MYRWSTPKLLRSIRSRKINEITTILPVATVRVAMAADAGESSITYTDKRGSYDNFVDARRYHRRMQASR